MKLHLSAIATLVLLVASGCSIGSSASSSDSPTPGVSPTANPTSTSSGAGATAGSATPAITPGASTLSTPTPTSVVSTLPLRTLPYDTTAPVVQQTPTPPSLPPTAGQVSTSLVGSCSISNGNASLRLTAGGSASGGAFVTRLRLYLDDVLVLDSNDVSAQRLTTLNRTYDTQPAAGTHNIRLVVDGSNGASALKTGSVTITSSLTGAGSSVSCSTRF